MKPLFIPLKTQYFNQFKAGTKTTEYRLYGSRWNDKTIVLGRMATLSHGYSGARLSAIIVNLRKVKNKSITDIYPKGATLAAIDLSFS
ncbi:MAG: hypothetical protein OEM38_00400 [Gammaproteobacteria bacterium]|nr:hypothetical protein [Gammaproteobacteria bacterium]